MCQFESLVVRKLSGCDDLYITNVIFVELTAVSTVCDVSELKSATKYESPSD